MLEIISYVKPQKKKEGSTLYGFVSFYNPKSGLMHRRLPVFKKNDQLYVGSAKYKEETDFGEKWLAYVEYKDPEIQKAFLNAARDLIKNREPEDPFESALLEKKQQEEQMIYQESGGCDDSEYAKKAF